MEMSCCTSSYFRKTNVVKSSFLFCFTTFMRVAVLLVVISGGKRCEARIKLPEGLQVPAVYGFGDSIVDQGMNNDLKTLVKANFPPYGSDLNSGNPSGRFSNGRTPADIIAEEIGLKELVPAYHDPNLTSEDMVTGVSFASGGTGYDPQTPAIVSVIPLTKQIEYFKEYIGRLKGIVGEDRAKFILANSLFLIVAGSDDLANTYFIIGLRQLHYDVPSYADLMVSGATSFIKELYNLGARRFAVFGAPPIGCLPSQRTLAGGPLRMCAEARNVAAQIYNSKLEPATQSLTQELPGSRVIYVNIYDPLLDLILRPQIYGFEVVDKGCCGTGAIEVAVLCSKHSPICEDRSKYLFWDSYHPTEKGYTTLITQIIQKYIDRFV